MSRGDSRRFPHRGDESSLLRTSERKDWGWGGGWGFMGDWRQVIDAG